MKSIPVVLRHFWLAAAMGIMLTLPAFAGNVDIAVPGGALYSAPGSMVEIPIRIANGGSYIIYLNGIGASLPDEWSQNADFELFETYAPDSLLPGETWEGPAFQFQLPIELPVDPVILDLSLYGGEHAFAGSLLSHTFFTVIDPAVSGVPPNAVGPGLLRASPNPFRNALSIQFSVRTRGRIEVTVFDVAGRCIRQIQSREVDPGIHELSWDGRNDTGSQPGSGIYFLRVIVDGRPTHTKVIKLN